MAEISPTPSPSHGIGSFEDNVASERLLAAIAAFNHRAAAQDIRTEIVPYTFDEAQQASMTPGLSFVVGWTINAIRNIPRRRQAAWHESEARRIEPFADSD